MGIYKILSEFAEQNEHFANLQYQRNAQQSANMQERDRGQSIGQDLLTLNNVWPHLFQNLRIVVRI